MEENITGVCVSNVPIQWNIMLMVRYKIINVQINWLNIAQQTRGAYPKLF